MQCETCGKKILSHGLDGLTRKEIISLLVQGVMEGKVKDTELFLFESGFERRVKPEVEEVLVKCLREKDHPTITIQSSRRMLRVMKE